MSERSDQPDDVRRRRLALLLIFAWLIAAVLAWVLLKANREDAVQALLDRDLAALSISWQAVQVLHRNSVTTYLEEYVQEPRTIELLQLADDPDRIDQARLQLFRHLSPAYERMVERGVRQFHFHRPNGDSFLRFHHPSRFGDNLLTVRESIRRVNSKLEPVFGFEVGRVVSGYRSVFPILDEHGLHLGSVELSMPFKVLQEELQALLPQHSIQLLLHAQLQRDILFDEQQSLYEAWPASSAFLIEDPHGLRPDSPPALPSEIDRLIQQIGEQPGLIEQMERGTQQAFRLRSGGRDYAVLMVPVFDPGGAEVGLVVSYVVESTFSALDRGLMMQAGATWLGLLVLALFLYFLLAALDEKLAERNRLKVITDTVGEGLYLTDTAGRIVSVNPYGCRLLGYSEDQMIGQSSHDFFHCHPGNEFMPEDRCPIIESVSAGREYRAENQFQQADGRLLEVMVVSRPLIRRGRYVGAVTLFEDIRERKEAERRLQELDQRLRKLGAEMPGFVYQYIVRADGSSAFVYASDGIRGIYGLTPERAQLDSAPVFAVLHADDRAPVAETIAVSARDLTPWCAIYRVDHPDKGLIWVEGHATPERLTDGGTIWHGYIHDVTEREHARRQLEESEAKYRTLVENAPVIIYRSELSAPWRMLHVSRGTERLSGHPPADFVAGSRHWGDLVHPDDIDHLEQVVTDAVLHGKTFEVEYRIVRGDGQLRWVHQSGALYTLDELHGDVCLQGIITDITQQKNDQLQLLRSAHYDALTGLPNRVLLADRLEQAMARAQRTDHILAVAFIDLDNFKPINDEHGHATGDELLVATAERMRSCLRGADTLARLGGDEFVAVLSDLSGQSDVQPLVQRLLDAVSSPVMVQGLQLQVTGSIGLTFYPQAGELDADQLLRQADQAMYQSKIKGRNTWHVFDLERDASVRGRHAALERFNTALANEELVLHYQPQVNLRTGEVLGVEALIRWQHPEQGLLLPGEFLPIIERTETDIALGQWVLAAALEQRQRWLEEGLSLTVAVNLSAHCLQKHDFLDCVDAVLAASPDLPEGALEFEILESSALSNLDGVSGLVDACRRRGIHFALDDFGTGYSSLSYLKRLPVSALKVDRSFVGNLEHDVDDLSILEGVLGLGRAFRLEVVAEGVETIGQGSLLRLLGCERAQGFGIARPMPANEIPAWTRRWRPDPVWQSGQALLPQEYPLLYALVEAQSAIRTLGLGLSGRMPATLLPPTRFDHIELALKQRDLWPDQQDFVAALDQVYQGLRRLSDRLQRDPEAADQSSLADVGAELEAIKRRLQEGRAGLG